METAYALDHRRELRRRGDDTWRETPPEFATYTTAERRQWFETYEKLREKEEEVRQLKRFLDDVEADAAKKQRAMMDAETLAEKPAPEGKRKATEPHPKGSKKARIEQVDIHESDEEDGTQSPRTQRVLHLYDQFGNAADVTARVQTFSNVSYPTVKRIIQKHRK